MTFIEFLGDNILIIGLVCALALLALAPTLFDNMRDKDAQYERELEAYEVELESSIEAKEAHIKALQNQIYSLQDTLTTMSASHGELTRAQNKALDMFEKQGIRISCDIIEELSYSGIDNVTACVSFINAQRAQWKLENTKKLYEVQ